GQLVAEALAPARGHDNQRVAAVERRLDALALPWPKDLVADVCEQRVRVPRPLIDARGAVGPLKSLESLESKRRLGLFDLRHLASLGTNPARNWGLRDCHGLPGIRRDSRGTVGPRMRPRSSPPRADSP